VREANGAERRQIEEEARVPAMPALVAEGDAAVEQLDDADELALGTTRARDGRHVVVGRAAEGGARRGEE
jgi:hypothetical protein